MNKDLKIKFVNCLSTLNDLLVEANQVARQPTVGVSSGIAGHKSPVVMVQLREPHWWTDGKLEGTRLR